MIQIIEILQLHSTQKIISNYFLRLIILYRSITRTTKKETENIFSCTFKSFKNLIAIDKSREIEKQYLNKPVSSIKNEGKKVL